MCVCVCVCVCMCVGEPHTGVSRKSAMGVLTSSWTCWSAHKLGGSGDRFLDLRRSFLMHVLALAKAKVDHNWRAK